MFDDLRILLIDDSAADRALATALLREELSGARIRDVNGAVDFAELLGYRTWTVAIAERELSWADGSDLLRAIKQHHPRCQTILFAKQPPDELGSLGEKAGVDAYVHKESAGYLRLPQLIREARVSERTAGRETGPNGGPGGLRSDIDAAPVGYFWILADGTFLEANTALATLLGVDDVNALKGRSLLECLPDDEVRMRCERSLLRGAREQYMAVSMSSPGDPDYSVRDNRFDQGVRECSLSFWPVPDRQGRACLEGMAWALSSQEAATPASSRPGQMPVMPDEVDRTGNIESREQIPASRREDSGAVVTPIRSPTRAPQPSSTSAEANDTGSQDVQEDENSRTPEPAALEYVPLKEALLAAMERLRPQLSQCGARIRAAQLPTLQADRSELIRLFRELLENSIEYRSQAQPRISVRAEEHGDGWLISMQDNGAGIPTAKRKSLFGPANNGLAGSGLAICRRVAKRYGGDVWLTSEEGKGTTIFVALKARTAFSNETALSIQLNGETMGKIAVRNASDKREIARAALGLPRLKREIGDQTIKSVQFLDPGVVNIVA